MLIVSYSVLQMDTKLKGDIAEQAAVLHALKRGWGVLKPFGDRLPYDLAFDVEGTLIKIQVKYAWLDEPSGNYVVDNRRTKTNRRLMLREVYKLLDFDFALVYSGSHSDVVQGYIAKCRGTACRAPTDVPHVNENRYIPLLSLSEVS